MKYLTGEETCTVPPEGWYCTRSGGHDGPCAAYRMIRYHMRYVPGEGVSVRYFHKNIKLASQAQELVNEWNRQAALQPKLLWVYWIEPGDLDL